MLSFPIIYYRNRVVPICWTAGQKNSYTRIFSKKDSGGHLQERKIGVRCRLRLYGESLSRLKVSLAHLVNYPGRANFSYISQGSRTWRTVYTTNKELARLEDAKVTLLTGPTFFPYIKLFGSRGRVRTIRACASALGSAKASTFSSYKLLLKLSRLGRFPSVAGKLFSLE